MKGIKINEVCSVQRSSREVLTPLVSYINAYSKSKEINHSNSYVAERLNKENLYLIATGSRIK